MTQAEMEKLVEKQSAQIEMLMAALTVANKTAAQAPVKEKKFVNGGKFWTVAPRYVGTKFIQASPEHPAVITFPKHLRVEVDDKGKPVDGTLSVYTDAAPVEKLSKPFAEVRRGPVDRKSHERDRTDGERRPADVDPAE